MKKRIAYLYPDNTAATSLSGYLEELSKLIATARHSGASVVVIKMPTPTQYRSQLPHEAVYEEAMSAMLATAGAQLLDFSQAMDKPRFYFDTDHMNRAGLREFFARYLKLVLMEGRLG